MKAQISFVEFITAFSIFSVFVAYLFFRLLSFMPAYLNEIRGERVRSEAYQISELLINDPGEPIDWDTKPLNLVKRIGLSNIENKTNFLSISKTNRFLDICDNSYEDIRKRIGTDFQFSVSIFDKKGLIVIHNTCIPPKITVRGINATVKRIVAFSSENYGELIVNVW